jgi:hypothetical protein
MRRKSHKFLEQQTASSRHLPTTGVPKKRIVKTKALGKNGLRGTGASINPYPANMENRVSSY